MNTDQGNLTSRADEAPTAQTDHDLMSFAAKAAGVTIFASCGDAAGCCLDISEGQPIYWNPLRNDADAFWLAVELRMHIAWAAPGVWTTTSELDSIYKESTGKDPHAATRRAIVRAAAAVGEAA